MKTTTIEKIVIGFIILILGFSVYGIVFNRKLYCEVAMFGQINSIPAFCIKEVVKEFINK